MGQFHYTARQRSGQQVSGTLAAATLEEANSLLRGMSLFPVKVEASRSLADVKTNLSFGGGKVKAADLVRFFSQMSDLLKSGVPLLRSLDIMKRQSSSQKLKDVLTDIHRKVADGRTLADAMGDHPIVFGELSVSMVRAGQEGGFLEDVFKRIAMFTERQEDLKGKVMGALAYPLVLLFIGTTIIVVLVVFFVPKFESIFQQLRDRGELPAMTEALLTTSRTLQSYGIFILAGLIAAAWFLLSWLKTAKGRRVLDTVKLKMPLMGVVVRDLAIVRFNRILGTLRRNGIPILNALRIAKDSTGNVLMMEAIDKAADNVKSGDKLATPLRASGVFPSDIVEMIEVAEESNSLEQVLLDSADSMESRTTRQLDLVVRFLEPLMLMVMAALTLTVVVALLLPIFKMSSALQ
jgi:general secretion pathway protein F/type IV pilus assembly protein PilC